MLVVRKQVPWHDRQTCMFTATWPQDCRTTLGRKQGFRLRCAESCMCLLETLVCAHCLSPFQSPLQIRQECKKLAETYIKDPS